MSGYIGTTPVPQATQHREAFTANANQTTFATAGYTVGYIDVWVNGVKLAAADVTVTNGSDIVLASAAAANDIVEYLAFVPFEAVNQTFTGATVVNSLNLNGDGATVTGIKDEDNMASNDANKLATQQSIKAYVDSTVAATNEVVEDTTPQLGGDLASNGNDILMADSDKVILGTGSDLQLYHDGSNSYVSDQGTGQLVLLTNSFRVNNVANSENIITAEENGAVNLFYNDSKKFETTSAGVSVTGGINVGNITSTGNLTLSDVGVAYFGTGLDLRIYHDGSDSYIDDAGAGRLWVRTNELRVQKYTGEAIIKGIADGAVELYHDNALKLATASGGVDVTGAVTASGLITATAGINLPTVNTYITGNGHNVLQVDGTRTYFYGGTNGVQFRTADNASALVSISNAGLISIAATTGIAINSGADVDHDIINLEGITGGGKLIWDHSATSLNWNKNLSITGTVTTGGNLHIAPGSNTPYITGGAVSTIFRNNANNASLITILNNGNTTFAGSVTAGGAINVTNGNSTFISGSSWGTTLELKNVNDDISPATLRLQKTPASGGSAVADNDYIGGVVIRGLNDAGENHNYIEMWGLATDVSNGSESSKWSIGTWASGTEHANTLVANAGKVGIGTAAPYYPFQVEAATVTNGSARGNVLFYDTTSATTGTGGGLALGGHSNGTTGAIYHFGNIQGIKENSTAGNYASAMLFSTRANGATPVERMRIGSTGAVTITNSLNINYGNVVLTSGYGIDFSATGNSSGSMSSELLDDYEEGTWSPVIQGAGGNSATATVGNANYTKVGRIVTLNAYMHSIDLTAITSGTYIILSGLPFNSEGYGDFTIAYKSGDWTTTSTSLIGGYTQHGTSYAYFVAPNGAEVQQSGSSALVRMMLNVTYQTT